MDLTFKARINQLIMSFGLSLFCISCSSTNFAPVYNGHHGHLSRSQLFACSVVKSGFYCVQKGDTLFSIAFRHNMDFRVLASNNGISAPYAIHVGQMLKVKNQNGRDEARPIFSQAKSKSRYSDDTVLVIKPEFIKQERHATSNTQSKPASKQMIVQQSSPLASSSVSGKNMPRWIWPTQGRVITRFNPSLGNKGIDISNQAGTSVFAAAGGVIVYQGDGLEGYGKLVIIKHNDVYLTAYAHNAKVYVHEGEKVQSGQKIATMGNTGTTKVMLHFEIRQAGKPVDPLLLLPYLK